MFPIPKFKQFDLRTIFFAVWAVAVACLIFRCTSSFDIGLAPGVAARYTPARLMTMSLVFGFGLPAVLVGYNIARGRLFKEEQTKYDGWVLRVVLVVLTGLAILEACRTIGYPYNEYSWLMVIGLFLWAVVIATSVTGRRGVALLLLALAISVHWRASCIPHLPAAGIVDQCSGRMGRIQFPYIFFVRDGVSTYLVDKYVGKTEPWWIRSGKSIRLYKRRVVGSPPRIPSIFSHPEFVDYLELLPSDEARRHVITCLSDRTNELRSHQALVLVALATYGFPQNEDSQSWWNKYRYVFDQEPDLMRAGCKGYVWRRSIRQRVEDGRFKNPPLLRQYLNYLEDDWYGPSPSDDICEEYLIGSEQMNVEFGTPTKE